MISRTRPTLPALPAPLPRSYIVESETRRWSERTKVSHTQCADTLAHLDGPLVLLGKEQRLAVLDMETNAVVGQSMALPFVIFSIAVHAESGWVAACGDAHGENQNVALLVSREKTTTSRSNTAPPDADVSRVLLVPSPPHQHARSSDCARPRSRRLQAIEKVEPPEEDEGDAGATAASGPGAGGKGKGNGREANEGNEQQLPRYTFRLVELKGVGESRNWVIQARKAKGNPRGATPRS